MLTTIVKVWVGKTFPLTPIIPYHGKPYPPFRIQFRPFQVWAEFLKMRREFKNPSGSPSNGAFYRALNGKQRAIRLLGLDFELSFVVSSIYHLLVALYPKEITMSSPRLNGGYLFYD